MSNLYHVPKKSQAVKVFAMEHSVYCKVFVNIHTVYMSPT